MRTTPFPAPDFNIDSVHLKALRGSWVVLYFYPKDGTPGCTAEACSFRDFHDEITALGAKIIGVSSDARESHTAFQNKHSLPFQLISDPDLYIIKKFDAWGPKMFGREGILRKTFIIDPDGIVQKVYGRVQATKHGEQVLHDLQRLAQQ